jgi:hypothetical protein
MNEIKSDPNFLPAPPRLETLCSERLGQLEESQPRAFHGPAVHLLTPADARDQLAHRGQEKTATSLTQVEVLNEPRKEPAEPKSMTASDQRLLASDGRERDELGANLAIAPWHWPAPMHAAARLDLVGEMVDLIGPNTEADPAALVLIFLAAFGNSCGPGPHFLAGGCPHSMRVWPNLVGETARGRKGSAWSSVLYILRQVDPCWTRACIQSGVSSGEGLIWVLRDPLTGQRRLKNESTQTFIKDPGVTDKRLFVVEEEFSSVLKVAARQGNTLSDVLRRAWDHGDLAILTKKSPARASGTHITLSGHITISLLRQLMTESEVLSGFGNRFLWACVRRSKLLPEGGALHQIDLSVLSLKIQRALRFAGTVGLVERTPAARQFWCALYPILASERAGLLGAITNRAEAQVMRLALLYAVLANSSQIDVCHLKAALAVWDFCERSAAYIFGAGLGDRIADRLLSELRLAGSRGLTQTAIRDLFQRNVSSDRITIALGRLEQLKLATNTKVAAEAKGRTAIVWKFDDQDQHHHGAGPIGSYLSFLS